MMTVSSVPQLSRMTIEEKVGQMMGVAFVPRYYNNQDPDFERLRTLVSDYGVGGIMFYPGFPYEIARTIERLQEVAPTPLLVMADIEWGLPQRIAQTTRFLQNMAVGATRNEDYAYEMGAITAREAKSMGIHVGFAPVMDVNNNPDNVIINTRSYGEDPALVSRLGAAFIRGMQAQGLFATAKHFPGHGDTNVDSHMHLPAVTASTDRLRRVELRPFHAAVAAGVKCVMVAHITYTAVSEMQDRPATLDRHFIEVLRDEMRFDGLILTDAMDMGGITEKYWSGEAAVMAINAGVDMLLMPPNFESTYAFVVNAVKAGRIPESRIDAAVRKLLNSKNELGLASPPTFKPQRMEDVVAHPRHLAKAEEIANAAMTLVGDKSNVLPFRAEDLEKVLVLTISDEAGGPLAQDVFSAEVQSRVPNSDRARIDPRSRKIEVQEILSKTQAADVVLAGVFISWRIHKGGLSLPQELTTLLDQIFRVEKPLAVVAFGSPYVLTQMPNAPSYLCAYDPSELAVRAAVRAVFGEIPIRAKLPVSIPPFHEVGEGLERSARKMELVPDRRDEIFEESFEVLETAVSNGVFAEAQLAVVCDSRLVANHAVGKTADSQKADGLSVDKPFDLGGLSPAVSTLPVAMHLWEQKRLLLDTPIKSYLPQFQGGDRDAITIRHLLTHTSGLPAIDRLSQRELSELSLDGISELSLESAAGDATIYSELGLLLVNAILETVTAKSLPQLVRDAVLQPMQLNATECIATTERKTRSVLLRNIGVRAAAQDVAAIAQMLLNGGTYRHRRLFSRNTVNYWTAQEDEVERQPWALGWHLASAGDPNYEAFSPTTFGCWERGTSSLLVDAEARIAIVLVANPTDETGPDQNQVDQTRLRLHRSITDAINNNGLNKK